MNQLIEEEAAPPLAQIGFRRSLGSAETVMRRRSSCSRRAASAGELAATVLKLRSTDKRTIG